MDRIAMTKTR